MKKVAPQNRNRGRGCDIAVVPHWLDEAGGGLSRRRGGGARVSSRGGGAYSSTGQEKVGGACETREEGFRGGRKRFSRGILEQTKGVKEISGI